MSSVTHDPRIEKMHGQDRLGALAFVVVLWIVILFVMIKIWPYVTDGTIRTILLIAGAWSSCSTRRRSWRCSATTPATSISSTAST